jgi:hypothetical protein
MFDQEEELLGDGEEICLKATEAQLAEDQTQICGDGLRGNVGCESILLFCQPPSPSHTVDNHHQISRPNIEIENRFHQPAEVGGLSVVHVAF